MVSSEPPPACSGNIMQLLDVIFPETQDIMLPPVAETGARPLDTVPQTLGTLDPLLVQECDLDDINNMCTG